MAKLLSAVGLLLLMLGAAAPRAQWSMSTARLSDPNTASAIDARTQAPAAIASTFAPETRAIYATTKLSNAPAGTRVKAEFHYLEGGDQVIAGDEVEASGTRFVSFRLSPPPDGWPGGQYEVRFLLNGKDTLRRPFNVSRSINPEDPDESLPLGPMKRFRDDTFGIGFELPSTWSYRLTPSRDYLFEGPKGTEAFEVSVILQFVTKAANPGSSAAAQSRGLEQKLAHAPNGSIEARDSVLVDGRSSPLFGATYTAADSSGAQKPFAHTQIVVDDGSHYCLISYSAPAEVYSKYLDVFKHMVQTIRFTR